jgi:hypothetical protein
VKIALCYPSHRQTESGFTRCLARLAIATALAGHELEVFNQSSSNLGAARSRLWGDALVWGADYMLCLDADHTFPPDALIRLLRHDVPVVAANYMRRGQVIQPVAAMADGAPVWTTSEKARGGELEEVDYLGLGFCLIQLRTVDNALRDLARREGKSSYMPLFAFGYTDDARDIGEEVFFFSNLARAGIKPLVDHTLSWEVGHIGEFVMTPAVAEQQRSPSSATRIRLRP